MQPHPEGCYCPAHQPDSHPVAFERTCIQLQAFVKAEHVQLSLKDRAYSCKLLGFKGRTCSAVFEWPCIQLQALVKAERVQLSLKDRTYSCKADS